jgi:hypothetical protein
MITDKFFNSLLEKFEQYIEAQSEELEQTKKAAIIKLIEERPVFEEQIEDCNWEDLKETWKELHRLLDELENNDARNRND